jgi:hypothetical protein
MQILLEQAAMQILLEQAAMQTLAHVPFFKDAADLDSRGSTAVARGGATMERGLS